MVQATSTKKVYTGIFDSLKRNDDLVKDLPYAQKFHMVYQMLMDLFSWRNNYDEITFIILSTRKMNAVKDQVVPAGDKQNILFHEFWKLGCSFQGLADEVKDKEIFDELKNLRNTWLEKEKSMLAFLILDKDFEAEGLLDNEGYKLLEEIFQLKKCENFSLALKPGVARKQIEDAIVEYYGEEYTSEKDACNVYIKNRGTERTRKVVTLTIMPLDNDIAAFSIASF